MVIIGYDYIIYKTQYETILYTQNNKINEKRKPKIPRNPNKIIIPKTFPLHSTSSCHKLITLRKYTACNRRMCNDIK